VGKICCTLEEFTRRADKIKLGGYRKKKIEMKRKLKGNKSREREEEGRLLRRKLPRIKIKRE